MVVLETVAHMESGPASLLIGALLFALISALIVLLAGATVPRRGDWLAALSIIVPLSAVIYLWSQEAQWVFPAAARIRGWVWPRELTASLGLGILFDPLGAACLVTTAVLGISALVLSPRNDRAYGAIALSTLGAALAAVSATLWMGMAAVAFSLLGALLLRSDEWENSAVAGDSLSGFYDLVAGFGLMFFGALMLTGLGNPVTWVEPPMSGVGADTRMTEAALALFLLGSLLTAQAFPFCHWTLHSPSGGGAAKAQWVYLAPAWISLLLLVRVEPQLHDRPIFVVMGAIAWVSAALTGLSGFLQRRDVGRRSLSAWSAAAFALAFGVLVFAGRAAGFAVGLGALVFTQSVAALVRATGTDLVRSSGSAAPIGVKMGAIAIAILTSGGVGSLSALGWVAAFKGTGDPVFLGAASFVGVILHALAWRAVVTLGWKELGSVTFRPAVASAVLLPLLGFSLFWSGNLLSGEIPGAEVQKLWDSLLPTLPEPITSENFPPWLPAAVYWAALAIGAALGSWGALRAPDIATAVSDKFPRAAGFVERGYGIGTALRRLREALRVLGQNLTQWLDEKVWGRILPDFARRTAGRLSTWIHRTDRVVARVLDASVRKSFLTPAKTLQLIQSGDVQWYLLFAIGSSVGLLLHFLGVIR